MYVAPPNRSSAQSHTSRNHELLIRLKPLLVLLYCMPEHDRRLGLLGAAVHLCVRGECHPAGNHTRGRGTAEKGSAIHSLLRRSLRRYSDGVPCVALSDVLGWWCVRTCTHVQTSDSARIFRAVARIEDFRTRGDMLREPGVMEEVIDEGWLHAIMHSGDESEHTGGNKVPDLGVFEQLSANALPEPSEHEDGEEDNHAPNCPLNSESPQELHRPRECQAQQSKKRRCNWTSELHSVFEAAVRRAGPRATPTTIRAAMDVESLNLGFELTVGMVKSHLQKYKLECQCANPSPLIPSVYKRSSDASTLREGSPAVESHSQERTQPIPEATGPSSRATLAAPFQPPPPLDTSQPQAILVTMLDAPKAMGVLVRTFTGYCLKVEYEHCTNTLVLTATPPPPKPPEVDSHAFGLSALLLLRDAQLTTDGVNELALGFSRRCLLPYAPSSPVVDDWPVQLVSTGEGDKTVCLQIEKASGRVSSSSALIIC